MINTYRMELINNGTIKNTYYTEAKSKKGAIKLAETYSINQPGETWKATKIDLSDYITEEE